MFVALFLSGPVKFPLAIHIGHLSFVSQPGINKLFVGRVRFTLIALIFLIQWMHVAYFLNVSCLHFIRWWLGIGCVYVIYTYI